MPDHHTKPAPNAWLAAALADYCPFCPAGDRRHIARDPELGTPRYQQFGTSRDGAALVGIDGFLACERCTQLWKQTAGLSYPSRRVLNLDTPPIKRIAPQLCLHPNHGLAFWKWQTAPYCQQCLQKFAALKPEFAREIAPALDGQPVRSVIVVDGVSLDYGSLVPINGTCQDPYLSGKRLLVLNRTDDHRFYGLLENSLLTVALAPSELCVERV